MPCSCTKSPKKMKMKIDLLRKIAEKTLNHSLSCDILYWCHSVYATCKKTRKPPPGLQGGKKTKNSGIFGFSAKFSAETPRKITTENHLTPHKVYLTTGSKATSDSYQPRYLHALQVVTL